MSIPLWQMSDRKLLKQCIKIINPPFYKLIKTWKLSITWYFKELAQKQYASKTRSLLDTYYILA